MSLPEKRDVVELDTPRTVLDHVHTRNCRVLPTRMHLLGCLPRGGVAAEIGVAFGDFTKEILARNKPEKLHLVDAWDTDRFRRGLAQIREQFSSQISRGTIEINQGLSTDRLAEFPDDYFDWVYIDTDHSYATTRQELRLAAQKTRKGGYIAGHDFTSGNPAKGLRYGVIGACHEFCVAEGWEYAYLTLEPSGHFSFALVELSSNGASA